MARKQATTRGLTKLLKTAHRRIYVLDAENRFLYGNDAFAQWLDFPLEDIVGLVCAFHSDTGDTPADAVAALLAPPPEVTIAAIPVRGAIARQDRDGTILRRRASFQPLASDLSGNGGLIVFLDDHDLGDDEPDLPPDAITAETRQSRELHQQLRQWRRGWAARYQIGRLVGESPAMTRVRAQVAVASDQQVRGVLVVGPRGTGREQIARTIHYASWQEEAGSLLPLNSAMMDAELLQAAVAAIVRPAMEADNNTVPSLLLLDADLLPPDAQAELAGFLSIEDFALRVLVTAERSLLEMAAAGEYRSDLVASLSTLVIELPPLKSRPEDIPILAQMLLEEANAADARQFSGFTPEAIERLIEYTWPGNIDEMVEVIRLARRDSDGPLIGVQDLPRRLYQQADASRWVPQAPAPVELDAWLADAEREIIHRALRHTAGNKTKAAGLLGISRARLLRRLEQDDENSGSE